MVRFRLREGVHACSFEDCAIVLDVRADRYWHVPAPLSETLLAVATGGEAADTAALAALQTGMALIVEVDDYKAAHLPADVPDPRFDPSETPDDHNALRIGRAAAIWAHVIAARCAVRFVSLERLLTRVRLQPPVDSAPVDAARIAREFDRYRGMMPLAARCLPDTLAFLSFARMCGCRPRLVFGVQAYPFAAHCWAQQGDLVLNDLADHARAFRRILVV